MLQNSGSGFFGSALRTAAGVAGGVVAADALMSLFSGHHSYGGGFGGAPMYPGGAPFAGSPWGGGAPSNPGYVDQGTWDQSGGGMPAPDQNYVDNGTWDQPSDPAPDTSGGDASWNDGGGTDAGGGWDAGDSGGGDSGGGNSGGGDSLC